MEAGGSARADPYEKKWTLCRYILESGALVTGSGAPDARASTGPRPREDIVNNRNSLAIRYWSVISKSTNDETSDILDLRAPCRNAGHVATPALTCNRNLGYFQARFVLLLPYCAMVITVE